MPAGFARICLIFLVAAPFLAAPCLVVAQPDGCGPGAYCRVPLSLRFYSVAEEKRYAVLFRAPESLLCPEVRYRVLNVTSRSESGRLPRDRGPVAGHAVWDTPPLGQGQIALLRIGGGFAPGTHSLTLLIEGPCEAHPRTARPLRLSKPGPDHGWRQR